MAKAGEGRERSRARKQGTENEAAELARGA